MRRSFHDEGGQTTTEYLMISGIMTTVAIFLLRTMQEPFRSMFQDIVENMINNLLDPNW